MTQWKDVCSSDDLQPDSGICALSGRPTGGDFLYAQRIQPFTPLIITIRLAMPTCCRAA